MATEVKLPRLGQGMESGTIVKWLKGEIEKDGLTGELKVGEDEATKDLIDKIGGLAPVPTP